MAKQRKPRLNEVEELIACGSLIEASRLLPSDRTAELETPRVLILASRLLSLRGRFVEARDHVDCALRLDEFNVDALTERARLALRFGDDQSADGWFERAYRQGAAGDDWMVDWIDLLLLLGKLDAARDLAMVRCERAPDQAAPWFRLGLAHQHTRHQLQALNDYRHAARIEPNFPMLCNNMGAAHLELKQFAKAKALLEQALRDDPDNALAWNNLATVLLKFDASPDSLIAAERVGRSRRTTRPCCRPIHTCCGGIRSGMLHWPLHCARRRSRSSPAMSSSIGRCDAATDARRLRERLVQLRGAQARLTRAARRAPQSDGGAVVGTIARGEDVARLG